MKATIIIVLILALGALVYFLPGSLEEAEELEVIEEFEEISENTQKTEPVELETEIKVENLEEADLEALKKQMPDYCQSRFNSCRAGCATLDEGDNFGQCDSDCEAAYQVCLS